MKNPYEENVKGILKFEIEFFYACIHICITIRYGGALSFLIET